MQRRPSGSRAVQDRRQSPAELDLTISAATGKNYVPFLRKHLVAAHRLLNSALSELSLALVGDGQMSLLHQRFMGIEGPTDVLTFPFEFDEKGREISGEVVICVPQAVRQAKLRGTRTDCELLLYALHGILHLSGFDDRTAKAFQRMHRKEDEILIRLGLGSVFATDCDKSGAAFVEKPHGEAIRATGRSKTKRIGREQSRRASAAKSFGAR
ncbi:MAG TPA: rRNA maturation RNase YbeY [Tepidisphaeraceae bacterium]|jgi:probable rRNA maturation factor|nr:rRNA maturation RNase YbeY [Tepidisphaeraceae bacterium]